MGVAGVREAEDAEGQGNWGFRIADCGLWVRIDARCQSAIRNPQSAMETACRDTGSVRSASCPWQLSGGATSEPNIFVVINEILADNGTSGRDPQNQYDDWIELYNGGDSPIDLGGMYLTDDLSIPTKWQIPVNAPAATTIAAHGYLLIWADGDTADAGLHAGFRLSADGEQVGLFAADGTTQIDGFSFDEQSVDISYGRYPDGDPNLQLLSPAHAGDRQRHHLSGHRRGTADQPRKLPDHDSHHRHDHHADRRGGDLLHDSMAPSRTASAEAGPWAPPTRVPSASAERRPSKRSHGGRDGRKARPARNGTSSSAPTSATSARRCRLP